jgi:RNA polymerase sigma factor (sigma-70 family)
MSIPSGQSVQIQGWLDRLQAGDESARNKLIDCACQRLERLTRKMLRGYERVHRWEQTGDVLQNALLRLYRALSETRPASVTDFFRLAAVAIRRELLDLAKHYYGPRGLGANHVSVARNRPADDESPAAWEQVHHDEPRHLAAWTEFHQQVARLPDEERALFDLLWYQELSQAEAAALLNISERTVKRRWAAARLHLQEALGAWMPQGDNEPVSNTAD